MNTYLQQIHFTSIYNVSMVRHILVCSMHYTLVYVPTHTRTHTHTHTRTHIYIMSYGDDARGNTTLEYICIHDVVNNHITL